MFSHVVLGANNLETSKKFYDVVFGALDVKLGVHYYKGVVGR